MAASFVAMNQVFGHIFDASLAEAATPEMAAEPRARPCRASSSSTATPISCATTPGSSASSNCATRSASSAGTRSWPAGTDHRRPQIRQLYQRDLHGQRHQGGAAVELAVGGAAGLVHPAGAGLRDPREGQQASRLPADAGAFHVHPGPARLARPGRRGDRDLQAGIRGRATPSATTPTRSWPAIRGTPTTKS